MSSLKIDKIKLKNYIYENTEKSFNDLFNYYLAIYKITIPKLVKLSNLDRRYVTKLKKKYYRPSKNTIIAISFGIKLDYDELTILLNSCGYSLSNSIQFDLIIKYFFEEKYYDLDDINIFLYENGYDIIGSTTRE